jgi:hypothetical protein
MYLYLHGLNSSGDSAKAHWLRAQLAPVPVLAPTYPAHRADASVGQLRAFIAEVLATHPGQPLVLVGSSMGGFYAQFLAPGCGARVVLVNPAIFPDEGLMDHLGPQINEATGERYELTAEGVRAMARYRLEDCHGTAPTLLLLDEADEVIDYRIARDFYQGCATATLRVFPGGGHRFDHLPEALADIVKLHDG